MQAGEKSLACEFENGWRIVKPELVIDFIDGVWVFENGHAKNCKAFANEKTNGDRKMKYQIADLINGPFGEIFDNLEDAEAALAEAIEEGQKANNEMAEDLGIPAEDASEFFSIVEA